MNSRKKIGQRVLKGESHRKPSHAKAVRIGVTDIPIVSRMTRNPGM